LKKNSSFGNLEKWRERGCVLRRVKGGEFNRNLGFPPGDKVARPKNLKGQILKNEVNFFEENLSKN
jgi:hypothetical protein